MMPQGQAELNSPIWSKGKWGKKRKGILCKFQMKRPRPKARSRVFDISKLFKHSVAMYFPIEGCSHHFKITNPSSLLASIGALSLISLNMSSLQTEATNIIQLLSNPNPEHEMWDFLTDPLLLEFHQPDLFEDVSKTLFFVCRSNKDFPQLKMRWEQNWLAGLESRLSGVWLLMITMMLITMIIMMMIRMMIGRILHLLSPSSAVPHHLVDNSSWLWRCQSCRW